MLKYLNTIIIKTFSIKIIKIEDITIKVQESCSIFSFKAFHLLYKIARCYRRKEALRIPIDPYRSDPLRLAAE